MITAQAAEKDAKWRNWRVAGVLMWKKKWGRFGFVDEEEGGETVMEGGESPSLHPH